MSRKVNPIDKDKITKTPHLLPYAHTLGGAIIKPLDMGRVKGLSMAAMYEQSDRSLHQIKEQVELLVAQAQEIHNRMDLSEKVYMAKYSFKPIIGKVYHLYSKKDESWILSMIGPEEWKGNCPYEFLSTMKLLSDHTWEAID